MHPVARIGPLTNDFRQQGYFSNFVFVGGSSRLGHSLGDFAAPTTSSVRITAKTENVLSAETEHSNCQKGTLKGEIALCTETWELFAGLLLPPCANLPFLSIILASC